MTVPSLHARLVASKLESARTLTGEGDGPTHLVVEAQLKPGHDSGPASTGGLPAMGGYGTVACDAPEAESRVASAVGSVCDGAEGWLGIRQVGAGTLAFGLRAVGN